MNHRLTCTALLFCLLAACVPDNGPRQPSAYRDLKGYFQQELTGLQHSHVALQKTVRLNKNTDSVTINPADSAQLQRLLQPFMETDLTKPSLQGAYDTILLPDQFSGKSSLLYKARNPNTVPQEITLNLDSLQHIESVQISKHVHNLVYELQQNLVYQQHKRIHISSWQKIAFLSPRELDVNVQLLHP
jgi:hypothetical protein